MSEQRDDRATGRDVHGPGPMSGARRGGGFGGMIALRNNRVVPHGVA